MGLVEDADPIGATAPRPASFARAGVVELRRYTLRPGNRPVLLRLFEDHLIAGQEAVGMLIGGIFEDADQPDRFVWWRAFDDMSARRRALEAFYFGPIWSEHQAAANATMIDSDDALLLQPTDPSHPGPPARVEAPGPSEPSRDSVATGIIRHCGEPDYERRLATELHRLLETSLQVPVSTWRTEPAENTFPRLPVRPEPAFVWSATFRCPEEHRAALARLRSTPEWPRWTETWSGGPGGAELMSLRPAPGSKHPGPAATRD